MKRYTGSCHCGAVRFEIVAQLDRAVRCTCSICRKKGALHHRVPPDRFRLVKGEEDLVLYRFNTATARHYFCRHCGIHPFAHPRRAPTEDWLVNLWCLDDFDPEAAALEIEIFDGRNWEQAAGATGTAPED